MAAQIDEHHHYYGEKDRGNNTGSLISFVLFIVVLLIIIMYGIPALQRVGSAAPRTEVNVPEQIDVNINQQQPNLPQQ